MIDPSQTGYPYLQIAKQHQIDYSEALAIGEALRLAGRQQPVPEHVLKAVDECATRVGPERFMGIHEDALRAYDHHRALQGG